MSEELVAERAAALRNLAQKRRTGEKKKTRGRPRKSTEDSSAELKGLHGGKKITLTGELLWT